MIRVAVGFPVLVDAKGTEGRRALELQRESLVPMLLDESEAVKHVDLCQLHTLKDQYLFLCKASNWIPLNIHKALESVHLCCNY